MLTHAADRGGLTLAPRRDSRRGLDVCRCACCLRLLRPLDLGSSHISGLDLRRRHGAGPAREPLGLRAGSVIALLWNGANLFATGFIAAALHTLHTVLSTGHISRPVLLLVLVGAAGHFLMIAGCLACFFRSSSGRRQWARFLGGAGRGSRVRV